MMNLFAWKLFFYLNNFDVKCSFFGLSSFCIHVLFFFLLFVFLFLVFMFFLVDEVRFQGDYIDFDDMHNARCLVTILNFLLKKLYFIVICLCVIICTWIWVVVVEACFPININKFVLISCL